jgi:hypothetical protein
VSTHAQDASERVLPIWVDPVPSGPVVAETADCDAMQESAGVRACEKIIEPLLVRMVENERDAGGYGM